MKKQEVFDTVAKHLFEQGKRATNDNGKCQYRAPDGCKCAVGALIPDELYDQRFENSGYNTFEEGFFDDDDVIKIKNKIFKHLGGKRTTELLTDLQSVHDDSRSWKSEEELKRKLSYTAKAHNVKASVLEGLTLAR